MDGEDNIYRGWGGEERGEKVSSGPVPYSSRRADSSIQTEPAKVEKPIVRLTYQAPEVITLTALDPVQLYQNSINPSHPEASDSGDALKPMVREFFEKLEIPVMSQIPISSVYRFDNKGFVVMKGLQFSQAMRDAFAKFVPKIQVCKPTRNQLLDEVHVDLDFFERIVLGELMEVRGGVNNMVMAVTAEA